MSLGVVSSMQLGVGGGRCTSRSYESCAFSFFFFPQDIFDCKDDLDVLLPFTLEFVMMTECCFTMQRIMKMLLLSSMLL